MSPSEDRDTSGFRETDAPGASERGDHPLLAHLLNAASGEFPPVDGGFTVYPPLPGGLETILSFTGHACFATRIDEATLTDLGADGFGGALHPRVLMEMAGPGGAIGVIDATLVAFGRGGGGLPHRADLRDHPRVAHALSLRSEVEAFGDERGLVTLGRGLAGRLEMSVEATLPGAGRGLIAEALHLAPEGEPVFAAVSPGNARSLRAFLSCHFVPIGSEVIVRP